MTKGLPRVSLGAMVTCAVALTSCIDHEYDLKGDNIDQTIQVGGNMLTVPASNTQNITLGQILELEDDSSIKEVERDGDYGLRKGDYVLLQEGESDPADYSVAAVDIDNMAPHTETVVLPQFVGVNAGRVTRQASTTNSINITNDEVSTEIVTLTHATTNLNLLFTVAYQSTNFAGQAIIEAGYEAVFNEAWTVRPVGETANVLEQVNNYTLRFKEDYIITDSQPFVGAIELAAVDFANSAIGQGNGLYEPGHFRLHNSVDSHGDISLDSNALPQGQLADLNLITTTEAVPGGKILTVTGIVNPEINIDATSFAITDVPDFLRKNNNALDIENPRIEFTVVNNSPLELEVNGKLNAYLEGVEKADVGIGSIYGTQAIIVPASATTTFVISRLPLENTANNIVQPKLGDIMETIPDEILFHDIDCKAAHKAATFELGRNYVFDANYRAIVPLAFGADMRLSYNEITDGWDTDLDGYNFGSVKVELIALNTLPLEMTPTVKAINKDGQEINTVTAKVEGTVAAGKVGEPAKSVLTILLSTNGGSLSGLDGMDISFEAKTGEGCAGVNLNAAQYLKLDDIRVTIYGGITVDIRDLDSDDDDDDDDYYYDYE